MVVPYDRAVAFFMESGRTEKTSRNSIRELMDRGLFADNGDGTLLLVRNDYGVELPSLEVCEVTDTIRIKRDYTELPRDPENPTYVGTTVRNGEVLHTCCSVMEDNIKKGKVKIRYGAPSIFGTKIVACPWCGGPVIYRKD